MVDGLAGHRKLKVHQALHGYQEGHRQLACSIALQPRDAKTLLVLSDISGPGLRIDGEGYLTGYPLSEAGLYAIAKTWSAPEMARPGCVWTHTLLIDFADLALPNSLADLLSAFRRPKADDPITYSQQLTLAYSKTYGSIAAADDQFARRLVSALYGHPRAKVICARPDGELVNETIAALWSQQWPRLRRSFRFCTLAGADRSTEGAAFDLQILPPGNQAVRTRFSSAVEAEAVALSPAWLGESIKDLMNPEEQGLRDFLRAVGGDVSGGRAAFAPLCKLYPLTIRANSDITALSEALSLLATEFESSQARAARATVGQAALSQAESLSEESVRYLLSHLDILDNKTLSTASQGFGRTIMRRYPKLLSEMLRSAGATNIIAEQTVELASLPDLVQAAAALDQLGLDIATRRPDLFTHSPAWRSDLFDEQVMMRSFDFPELVQPALLAMIEAGKAELADTAVRKTGAANVLGALVTALKTNSVSERDTERWLKSAATPAALTEIFDGRTSLPLRLLSKLTRIIDPDDLPNENGVDPWFTAVLNAEGEITTSAEIELHAFLVARSLGFRSKSPAALARMSFERTYDSIDQNALSYESWRLLDRRLPWSLAWTEWDKCRRLKTGMVQLFVDRHLSLEDFIMLAEDDQLFRALVDEAARTSSGRAYLREAKMLPEKGRSNEQRDARVRYMAKSVR